LKAIVVRVADDGRVAGLSGRTGRLGAGTYLSASIRLQSHVGLYHG
jgi:polygalacturonase